MKTLLTILTLFTVISDNYVFSHFSVIGHYDVVSHHYDTVALLGLLHLKQAILLRYWLYYVVSHYYLFGIIRLTMGKILMLATTITLLAF